MGFGLSLLMTMFTVARRGLLWPGFQFGDDGAPAMIATTGDTRTQSAAICGGYAASVSAGGTW